MRLLRRYDRAHPARHSLADALATLVAAPGSAPTQVRAQLARLFVMPVLTAHPTEARRRTVRDHVAEIGRLLEALEREPGLAARPRRSSAELEREVHGALAHRGVARDQAVAARRARGRARRVRAHALRRDARACTASSRTVLARLFPSEDWLRLGDGGPNDWVVPSFLRWGSWIGGDRDGNPFVTAHVTRTALERQRALALERHLADVEALGRSAVGVGAARAEPARASRSWSRRSSATASASPRSRRACSASRCTSRGARSSGTWTRACARRSSAASRRTSTRPATSATCGCSQQSLVRARLRRARARRAARLPPPRRRVRLPPREPRPAPALGRARARGRRAAARPPGLAARARLRRAWTRRAAAGCSATCSRGPSRSRRRRARRSRPRRRICSRRSTWSAARAASRARAPASATSSASRARSRDLLEVLFLQRAAGLAPGELRPVPLLEQLEDLANARPLAEQMLASPHVAAALGPRARGDDRLLRLVQAGRLRHEPGRAAPRAARARRRGRARGSAPHHLPRPRRRDRPRRRSGARRDPRPARARAARAAARDRAGRDDHHALREPRSRAARSRAVAVSAVLLSGLAERDAGAARGARRARRDLRRGRAGRQRAYHELLADPDRLAALRAGRDADQRGHRAADRLAAELAPAGSRARRPARDPVGVLVEPEPPRHSRLVRARLGAPGAGRGARARARARAAPRVAVLLGAGRQRAARARARRHRRRRRATRRSPTPTRGSSSR